jgi:1-deoxy-D-xylulose-5-phosphate synthase
LLHEVFSGYRQIITVEDGAVTGGFGSAVLEFMAKNNYTAEIKMLGIPDKIVEHGTPKELYVECNYDVNAIVEAVKQFQVSGSKLQVSGHQYATCNQ